MDSTALIRRLRPAIKQYLKSLTSRPGTYRPEVDAVVQITNQSVKEILGHTTPNEAERLYACLMLPEGLATGTFIDHEPDYKQRDGIEFAYFQFSPFTDKDRYYTIVVKIHSTPGDASQVYTIRASYTWERPAQKSDQPPGVA